jgi:hypothetical protein
MDVQTVVVAAAIGAGASLFTSSLLEGIKLTASRKLWLAQEQWKLRRDIHMDLLRSLS